MVLSSKGWEKIKVILNKVGAQFLKRLGKEEKNMVTLSMGWEKRISHDGFIM